MKKDTGYNTSEKMLIYALSSLLGLLVVMGCVLLAAALFLAGDICDEFSSVGSSVCLAVGGLLAGFVSSKKIGSKGIINGFFCGLMIYAVILFLSLFISENGFSLISLFKLIITLFASCIGGILGVTSASRRKLF